MTTTQILRQDSAIGPRCRRWIATPAYAQVHCSQRCSTHQVTSVGLLLLRAVLPWMMLCPLAVAQVVFVDVSSERGIGPYFNTPGYGGGVAAADYDGDGYVDFFVPQDLGHPDLLYRNLGDGSFEEVAGATTPAGAVGLADTFANRTALWLDFDGDKDLDLLVANDVQVAPSALKLYRQQEGVFEDVTVQAGLFLPPVVEVATHHWAGMCAGDINNDGYLDIFTGQYRGTPHLFLNNKDGTFSDISLSSGVGVESVFNHQCVMADFNGDGWVDIYASIDFGPNQLWINQKDLTFVDMAVEAGADNYMNDMGLSVGDYDNDGDLDIFVTNVYMPSENPLGPRYNLLLQNESMGGAPLFDNVSQSLEVGNADFGWGATFLDIDRDMDLDIAVTNGWRSGDFATDPSRMFRNNGNGAAFSDVSDAVGFNDTYWGGALIAVDWDRDGDPDLIQTCNNGPLRFLENRPADPLTNPHYLMVRPRMDGPNHFAIGAIVRVTARTVTQMRLISAGTSYLGQEPAEALFGLGAIPFIETLAIDWPDGSHTVLPNVAVDQTLIVTHGGFGDLDADGDVDLVDHGIFTGCFTGVSPGGVQYTSGCRPADVNGDGGVDLRDFAVIQPRMQPSE